MIKFCSVLGDNIFYGQYFVKALNTAKKFTNGATVFLIRCKNPNQFAVIELSAKK